MKIGDRCWVPVTVAGTYYAGDRILAAESVWHASETLPDHSALEAVAAWLKNHFDEDKAQALSDAISGIEQWIDGCKDNGTPDDMLSVVDLEKDLLALRDLLAALGGRS